MRGEKGFEVTVDSDRSTHHNYRILKERERERERQRWLVSSLEIGTRKLWNFFCLCVLLRANGEL
jgi:hypothetical protein